MQSMKVIILLLFCYTCLSTDNPSVYFVSRNFNNVLHWDPVEPALENVTNIYSVQYWSDAQDQPFQKREGCQNTTALFCDLTEETPSVYDVHYQAQVFVNGRRHGRTTNKFKPIADTILGPPILSTHETVTSLHVNVTLPLGPNGVSIADIFTSSKNGPSKTVAIYILKITDPEWAEQYHEKTTGLFVINLKNNQTKYCGYVVYKPYSEWGRPESEKASFCITLPGDPLRPLLWPFISAALVLAVIIMLGVYMCNYVKAGKKESMPKRLVPTPSTQPRVQQSPDRNIIISNLDVCPISDQTIYAKIRVESNVPSVGVGGYSPQDIPCHTWQGSSGSFVRTGAHSLSPNQEDTSAQSSEIYSVVAVHVKDFQQGTVQDGENSNQPLPSSGESWDKDGRSPKLTSHGVPLLHDPDCWDSDPAKPLLLHTVRGINGQLTLPSLISQLQSNTGVTEGRPLLSDLTDIKREGPSLASLHSLDGSEWSDSGCDSTLNTPTQPYCNTNYSPSKPVVSDFHQGCQDTLLSNNAPLDSGYKPNWIPAILLGTASTDSF